MSTKALSWGSSKSAQADNCQPDNWARDNQCSMHEQLHTTSRAGLWGVSTTKTAFADLPAARRSATSRCSRQQSPRRRPSSCRLCQASQAGLISRQREMSLPRSARESGASLLVCERLRLSWLLYGRGPLVTLKYWHCCGAWHPWPSIASCAHCRWVTWQAFRAIPVKACAASLVRRDGCWRNPSGCDAHRTRS